MDTSRVAEIYDPKHGCGGTGYLIRPNMILTAHHVIAPLGESVALGATYDVRLIGDYKAGQKEWLTGKCRLCWDAPEIDLALLELDRRCISKNVGCAPIKFGRMDADTLPAEGYGFPKFQVFHNRQNPEIVSGHLNGTAGMKEGRLRLHVTSLVPDHPADWEGISGTALFVEDCLAAVVVVTNKGHSGKTLWAVPIALAADDEGFCKFVGDNGTAPLELVDLPTAVLSADYTRHVKSFIDAYVGTAEHPEPFGGRSAELIRLDAWLDDPNETPYLLLAAEAGRGKSALLVHWRERLRDRDDVDVVFFPVSIRFDTNRASIALGTVAINLAALQGEVGPASTDVKVDVWRKMISDYLGRPLEGGRRVVLILDGVDEAADWDVASDLFPRIPAEGVRVVVSARYLSGDRDSAAWLERLGWDKPGMASVMALPALPREGITDILKRVGLPFEELAPHQQLVSELHRLSGGDPLLIRMHIEDLRCHGNAIDQSGIDYLSGIHPGLEGYFNRWWKEQRELWGNKQPLREISLQAVLNVLACALAPLTGDDLLSLVSPEADLTSWTLPDTLLPMARLIIGDGSPNRGYAFSHPRLNSYFYKQLSAQERRNTERRFLMRGKQTLVGLNAGDLSPDQASSYLVRHYGTHLVRTKAELEQVFELLSDGWRQAWYQLEGSYEGFLNDVQRAGSLARIANEEATEHDAVAPYLGMEIRCALCFASIQSLNANLQPMLVRTLVEKGVWMPRQGLIHLRNISDPKQRAEALSALAPFLSEPLFPEANSIAQTIEEDASKAEAICSMIDFLPASYLPQLLESVRGIEDDKNRARTLVALTPRITLSQIQEVLDLIKGIRDNETRIRTMIALTPILPEPRQGDLLETIRAIKDRDEKARLFAELAPHLPPGLKETVLREALDSASTLGVPSDVESLLRSMLGKSDVLSLLAPQLSSNLLKVALEKVREIDRNDQKSRSLALLARVLPVPLLRQAMDVARDMPQVHAKLKLLLALGPQLSEKAEDPSVLEEAIGIAREISDPHEKAGAIATLVPHLPAPPKAEMRDRVRIIADHGECRDMPYVAQVIKIARGISDPSEQAKAIAVLALYLSASPLAEALDTARAMNDPEKSQIIAAVAPHLPRPLLLSALGLVWIHNSSPGIMGCGGIPTTKRDNHLYQDLAALAPYLDDDLLRQTLDQARARDDSDRKKVITALAPYLPDFLLPQVLDIARGTEYANAKSVTALLSGKPDQHSRSTAMDALRDAQTVADNDDKAEALAALALRMPKPIRKPVLKEALETTLIMENDYRKADVLVTLAPECSESMLRNALAATSVMKYERCKMKVFTSLASRLSAPLLPDAISTLRTMDYAPWKTISLAALAPGLDVDASLPLFREVLSQLSCMMHDDAGRSADSGSQKVQVLKANNAKEEDKRKVEIIVALMPNLSERLTAEALEIACQIDDHFTKAIFLVRIVEDLPQQLFSVAVETARTVDYAYSRALTLVSLAMAPRTPESMRESVITEALETARRIEEIDLKASALTLLAPFLHGSIRTSVLEEALETVCAITAGKKISDMLEKLIPHLSEQMLDNAFAKLQGIEDDDWRHDAMALMAPYLPEALRSEALETARRIESSLSKCKVLTALAPHLSNPLRAAAIKEAVDAVKGIWRHDKQTEALSLLAPYLSERQSEDLLEMAHELKQGPDKAKASALLMGCLAGSRKSAALRETLEAVRHIASCRDSVEALADLAPHLPESMLKEVLVLAKDMDDANTRAKLLVELEQYLPDTLLETALEVVQPTGFKLEEIRAFVRLAPRLAVPQTDPVFAEALKAISSTDYCDKDTVAALELLASHLSGERLPKALSVARNLDNETDNRVKAFASLLPYLQKSTRIKIVAEALQAARDIKQHRGGPWDWRCGDAYHRAKAISLLLPHLSESQREGVAHEALEFVRHIKMSDHSRFLKATLHEAQVTESIACDKAEALVTLIPNIPQDLFPATIETAKTIHAPHRRCEVLAALARNLPEHTLQQLKEAARMGDEEYGYAEALASLAAHLPEPHNRSMFEEALAAARAIPRDRQKAETLTALAKKLPEYPSASVLKECLEAAQASHDDYSKKNTVAALAGQFPESMLQDAMETTRSIGDDHRRFDAAIALAAHLPKSLKESFLRETLEKARMMKDDYRIADAFISLVPHLPEESRAAVIQEALEKARMMNDDHHKADALITLIPHLPEESRAVVLQEALETTNAIDNHSKEVNLTRLAPLLSEPLLRKALELTGLIKSLIPHLSDNLLQEALEVARNITDAKSKVWTLVELIPRLPETEKDQVAGEALETAASIDNSLGVVDYRFEELAALAPLLPVGFSREALRMALNIWRRASEHAVLIESGEKRAIKEFEFNKEKIEFFSQAATQATLGPVKEAYLLLREVLLDYGMSRNDLLRNIKVMVPVIDTAGGEQALVESATAIKDTTIWWP